MEIENETPFKNTRQNNRNRIDRLSPTIIQASYSLEELDICCIDLHFIIFLVFVDGFKFASHVGKRLLAHLH